MHCATDVCQFDSAAVEDMTSHSDLPKESRRRLGLKHAMRVRAAEYWLSLGKFEEASRELEGIQLSRRSHPEVQRMRARIQRAADGLGSRP
jgi:hypothetical protein